MYKSKYQGVKDTCIFEYWLPQCALSILSFCNFAHYLYEIEYYRCRDEAEEDSTDDHGVVEL